ncbi:MAG: acyl-CoA carboxylase subunit beta [Lachnospiraceae bacterium]|jgi:acetyl-CoA carboxylase carboxyltransferase component
MKNAQEELTERKKTLRAGSGKAVEKQHARGKMTARERLDVLFDKGTFVEEGLFVRHRCVNFGMEKKELPADGVVTGHGLIGGRLVYAYAQDFTVSGGSLGEMHAKKIARVQEEALRMRAPIIGINDSGGARIQEGVDALAGYGQIFLNNTRASGVIPQISVIMGPCAGGAVYSPAITDFVFMVRGESQMFITGPKVVQEVTGEKTNAEDLGGADVHESVSGCSHFTCDNEKECFAKIRKLLSYLPQSCEASVPFVSIEQEKNHRRDYNMDYAVPDEPGKGYDMHTIVEHLSDDLEFFEIQKEYAKNVLIGFIRLNGKSVGVIASQPMVYAGCLDIDASDKAARFVRFCDAFDIPLLTLVDVPGYMPGTRQEHGGIIRHGAKLLYAYSEATVPKVTVIVRKAYGGAYIGMCSRHLGADAVYAWPGAEIAVMGAEGAADIIFAKEIRSSENPEEVRQARIRDYQKLFMSPDIAAARGFVDDIITPSETRERLKETFRSLESKHGETVAKRHGNIPL